MQKARGLGFTHVGFAKAEALGQEATHLHEWLGKGYQAEMHWMERRLERRKDPREIVQGAVSVISVAMNYYTPLQHTTEKGKGKISRYAWGEDYHDLMDQRLADLEDWIRIEYPGTESRRYVDTGPVMDKAWAVRSGIGWLGKHSNVITRDYGSWVFLGEIITTLELDYAEIMPDFCGSCTTCLDACPTDAIVEPYVVDASRCISYLTIEYRGEEFPADVDGDFESWVYGCDICQDVCPWNSFARESTEAAFEPRDAALAPNLRDLADINDEDFREQFRGSPVKRAKAAGIRRNARTVLRQQESYTDR
ncbi:tRNA epoxyqueuosine(34) reductase QueG [bacterium]|nr:tRNA epoxyqueuosine(34) reductase QueG [bacterium]